MYVARYSQVDVVNTYNTLYLRIYGLDKNNKLKIYTFVPQIPNLLDGVISKSYLLGFIAKYLIQGKESVSSVDFKRHSSLFYTSNNQKSENWEAQIEAILAELDRLGPPKEATDPEYIVG
ncbi:hypothetical protein Xmau_02202 [Xenorhabdus mauleonii]|uniref:Uncharacterized protein n=1 Tax=Xenorhabdus mauleonii TaxID=351675 RepID=A0A1I3QB05_9GAMM|nr:hypothetical protein [Xenorhabdus mauleonii]PHM40018.1 hypothetical protein Xmau_02202 [Xenorhabdus mauleonii]SFJ31303.1 hypothetical protein SAMN05421680_107106 [Xenorhabdus mauleonii]